MPIQVQPLKSIVTHPNSLVLLGIMLSIGLLYSDTWQSMIAIWQRSDTYMHGFFVIPTSLWLIWQRKSLHTQLQTSGLSTFGFIYLLLNSVLWLLGSLIHALVIEQWALVGLVIGAIWFYWGNTTTQRLLFPLIFLYFMVPVGEALVPYLMQFTAEFTIALIRLSGISVYQEGLHFMLPSGDWSVVEACSGIRYLLASITLGTIYAYLTYRKAYKQVIFILFSSIFPIFANGMRAYMIVMIGHLSGMKLATGADHLVYGGVFFGIIIFLMFYIGSFWKDNDEPTPSHHQNCISLTYNFRQNTIFMVLLSVGLGMAPLTLSQINQHFQASTELPQPQIIDAQHWQETSDPHWGWTPRFNGAVIEKLQFFSDSQYTWGIYQANFGNETQGELINSQNILIRQKQWHIVDQKQAQLPGTQTLTDFATLKNKLTDETIETYSLYTLGHYETPNPYLAKLIQLYKRITFNDAPEIRTVFFRKLMNRYNTSITKPEGAPYFPTG